MKAFSCGDVVPGCNARWVCSADDEILQHVAAHAAEAHGLATVPPELVEQVRRSIVAVA